SVLLERLMVRDGLSADEALARLRTEHGLAVAADEAVRLAAVLPRRQERRWLGEEELLQIPVDGQVGIRIEEKELAPLLRSLPAEDRLLLKMHFVDGLSIAAIAPILGRPQRKLYSVQERCLKKLRRC